jgi:hypothetical protein
MFRLLLRGEGTGNSIANSGVPVCRNVCCKPQCCVFHYSKVAGSISCDVIGFLLSLHNPSSRALALGLSQPQQK